MKDIVLCVYWIDDPICHLISPGILNISLATRLISSMTRLGSSVILMICKEISVLLGS